ncbi:hypothetical protein [Kordia sp.]|uniref:hypothetical protein n=1 Tax=Kordia sp. TaxID=1965332 RepID=UPI003D2E436D
MKKKNLKSLRLNKNSISNMNSLIITGGTNTVVWQSCPAYYCFTLNCTAECQDTTIPIYATDEYSCKCQPT